MVTVKSQDVPVACVAKVLGPPLVGEPVEATCRDTDANGDLEHVSTLIWITSSTPSVADGANVGPDTNYVPTQAGPETNLFCAWPLSL
jgi:hypothetical protein